MATFTSFNDRLPDPTFAVNDAGAVDVAGSTGPGFSTANVQSVRPVQMSRTNSGRGVHTETGSHYWGINITYNPMRREQFDTVAGFLEARNGRLNPFFVVLPQYSKPKDATFAAYATANLNTITVAGTHEPGSPTLTINTPTAYTGKLRPGDFFTVTDEARATHTKTYKIVRVETHTDYQTGSASLTNQRMRLHISPPLSKTVGGSSIVNFINPKFRVVQVGDVLESNLNTDNLYQFQLSLEEIQP
jgi:hypothetical protein